MRWVVIKSWRDAGPTTSPDYRWWTGCVEDRTPRDPDEWPSAASGIAGRLSAAGIVVTDMHEEPCCDHEDRDEEHWFGECAQAFVAAYVRVPARDESEAYRATCSALGLGVANA